MSKKLDKAVEMYKRGEKVYVICVSLNIHASELYRALVRNNVKLRRGGKH